MTLHRHDLRGCAPAPLAFYLKALGILRLVAEQADPEARGWWENEGFVVCTTLSEERLREFFLCRYEPTPIFNPWGARSGFYGGGSENSARKLLEGIESQKDPRFSKFQRAIQGVRTLTKKLGNKKPESPAASVAFVFDIRSEAEDAALSWLDVVMVPVSEGRGKVGTENRVGKPPLFGTGGNEGSGGYASAFMAAIDACLISRKWDHALSESLWRTGRQHDCLWSQSFGQFLPGGLGSPWDLLLAFEGALVVRAAATRKSQQGEANWLSSPFLVETANSGFPSASDWDRYVVNKGKKLRSRGEQWFPLWSKPALQHEVLRLFNEGRATLAKRSATTAVSLVGAISGLGVARGIGSFVRYGYLQRNNLATHFAVDLGRFYVNNLGSTASLLLQDVLNWRDALNRARFETKKNKPPERFLAAVRRLDEAVLSLGQKTSLSAVWQDILLAVSMIEACLVTSPAFTAKQRLSPIPPLDPEWILVADDGSAEFRLALALATAAADPFGKRGVREHWLPLDPNRPDHFAVEGGSESPRLRSDPNVVACGNDAERDCIAIVRRRLITRGGDCFGLPLVAAAGCEAASADVAALLDGLVDLPRTIGLARALMAVRRRGLSRRARLIRRPPPAWTPPVAALIRLAHLPFPLPWQSGEVEIRTDPSIVPRLAAGDLSAACELARRRLVAAGLRPILQVTSGDEHLARRIAVSLAFPISPHTAQRLANEITSNAKETT